MSNEQNIARRIPRSKKLIRTVLIKLLNEKSIEEITVADITTKADISRGTFYLHYQDKYDLIEKTEQEILNEVENIGGLVRKAILHSSKVQETEERVLRLFEYVALNAAIMQALLGPTGNLTFQVKLKKLIKNIYLSGLIGNQTLVPAEYLSSYIASAHLGVLQEWLDTGLKESPSEMAKIISKTTIFGPASVVGGEE
ncbi:TetR/AcrR family transcriptional regulator C-terminal domain-containing protein [Sporosarcina sp. FSL W7-1349]|uniref:TetR/AcrR family transcriptional regulator n=1 Tax=Sporosarcina sp. FSL W7-1349 TaxID=2921561 RepID=UPI0030F5511A